ncbi:hypothetical protein N5J43_08350 [Pseudomonas nicosulfuronedens]|uniref:hypothetical protein n=1 Tax=Pseudomonas nicosulfuronedens TaxID=2571105 RepID=UPI00244943D9|nr:hypothetical protein [Pseudomonas nicosulfuronedens]MDH1009981.1 hypothetical protein [Pseudomonas nicosulfuronedens]MDH1978957.1 hypothetical protein [Pseudomonas nicosulfuronedens]MDH2028364.1 hypothetical protein [Pseudomonas nicosulfuronedens]
MLSCDQIAELAGALCATAEALGQTLTPTTAEVMAADLADYDIDTIATALQSCRRELAGRLTLASILQRIQAADGRPEPNEAWAIALASFDEAETVLTTPEIQQAATAASAIFAAGDKIGARMAFIAAYERLVATARQLAQPVAWTLSLGYDAPRRVLAIEEAQRLGRLPAPAAQQLLEHHGLEPVSNDGRAIAGLLTGDVVEASPGVREKLDEIRQGLLELQHQRDEERRRELLARREAFERRRAETLETIKELEETRHA